MLSLLWLLIVGLVAGALARLIVPGKQSLSIVMTILLGVIGSFVGGFIGSLLPGGGSFPALQTSGFIFSTIGAIVVLLVYQQIVKRRSKV